MQRLAPLFYELETVGRGLDALHRQQPHDVKLPRLPAGAWESNGPALGALLAAYELLSELATFYEELQDLKWLLKRHIETWHGGNRLQSLWFEIQERAPRLRAEAARLEQLVRNNTSSRI